MFGISQRVTNKYLIAISVAERSAKKIDNANIEIETIPKGSLPLAEQTAEIKNREEIVKTETEKLQKYNRFIDYVENKYFN